MKVIFKTDVLIALENVYTYNANNITIDPEDIERIFSNKNKIYMNDSEYQGIDAASKAVKVSLHTMFKHVSIDSTMSFLLHYRMHPDYSSLDILKSLELLESLVTDDTNIIMGTSCDTSLTKDFVELRMFVSTLEDPLLYMSVNSLEYRL